MTDEMNDSGRPVIISEDKNMVCIHLQRAMMIWDNVAVVFHERESLRFRASQERMALPIYPLACSKISIDQCRLFPFRCGICALQRVSRVNKI